MKPRKLTLDLAALRVESFAPVERRNGKGTILGYSGLAQSCWCESVISCVTGCNCPSPNTFDPTCDCPPEDTSPETGCG